MSGDLSDAVTDLCATLARYAVQIVQTDDRDRPMPLGTGVLVSHLGQPYLATAAHVLTEHARTSEPSNFYFFVRDRHAVAFGNRGYIHPKYRASTGEQFELDVALFPIDAAEAAIVGTLDRGCLPSHFLTGAPPNRKVGISSNKYILSGFPVSKATFKRQPDRLESDLWSLYASEASIELYQRAGFDPQIHLLLLLDKKDMWRKEQRVRPPHLHGVSGGPIWHFYDDDTPLAAQAIDNILVAIAIEHRRDLKCVVGLRCTAILGLLRMATQLSYAYSTELQWP